ncbi:MAG: beta-propeller domain-containing protein [Acidobacteria bacterium]|nr:beta-propeller domain-containing protein [Candidatus Sulfomarinibacter kjeldsenii]
MKSKHGAVLAFSICLAGLSLAASFDDRHRAKPSPRTPVRRVLPVRPVAPSTNALQALESCDEVQSYLIDVAVERVLEYRYNYHWFMVPWAGGAGDGREVTDVPSDFTTTNTQEQGVDELDIVKTNGTHLYAAEGYGLHILRSWPAESTSELAKVTTRGYSSGLFLRGDRVLVASQVWSPDAEFMFNYGGTRLELLDVSDPSSPAVLRTIDIEGWLVDARLIDGDLYAVLRSYIDLPSELWDLAWREDIGLPDLPWDVTDFERERILAEARAILKPYVNEIMGRYPLEEMLPRYRDDTPFGPDTAPSLLLDCGSIYRPEQTSDWSILSVLHLDLDEGGPVTTTGLIADGWTVYASRSNLYVAQTSNSWSWWWGWAPAEMSTVIHKFELDPSAPEPVQYVASGDVKGWILDQFSMSEYDGHLRVAATEFDWWWGATPDTEPASSVSVLKDDDLGNLREVGHVGGLGPGERIFAVRFMGAKGYVVTFEQIDPLYTLDLSDPAQPKVVGELEVTGFSSYLHPIGNDWLLAVGQEADEEGRVIGLAVSIFDVRDFADPKLAHRYLIEGEEDTWSWSEALHDHHAFTYHRGVLSIPAYIGGAQERFGGLLVLAVDPEDGIFELGRIDHQDLSTPDGRARMRRSVYIEDAIYSLSSAGVKVNSLHNPEVEIAKVPFEE